MILKRGRMGGKGCRHQEKKRGKISISKIKDWRRIGAEVVRPGLKLRRGGDCGPY